MNKVESKRVEMPSIESFAQDCRELAVGDFRVRHGGAFLLMRGAGDALCRPGTLPEWTVASESASGAPGRRSVAADYVVIPIKPRRPSRLGYISVGRAQTCDLVVPDISVSLYHAFIREERDGGFVIQDASSTNGTFVDDERVPAQGKGPPTRLESGAEVRLGNREFLFLGCAEFRELIRTLVS